MCWLQTQTQQSPCFCHSLEMAVTISSSTLSSCSNSSLQSPEVCLRAAISARQCNIVSNPFHPGSMFVSSLCRSIHESQYDHLLQPHDIGTPPYTLAMLTRIPVCLLMTSLFACNILLWYRPWHHSTDRTVEHPMGNGDAWNRPNITAMLMLNKSDHFQIKKGFSASNIVFQLDWDWP